IVGNTVVMEPVTWRWINELAGIISTGDHSRTDDVSQIPLLQNPSCSVNLNIYRVIVCCGIRIQDDSNFTKVDIVVKIDDSEVAVIGKLGYSAVEINSNQFAAPTHIGCVIKKDRPTGGDASRAYPSQCAVRIDDARCKIAATAFNHDVVVAQISVICTSLQDGRILVSAWIVEDGGRDSRISLL